MVCFRLGLRGRWQRWALVLGLGSLSGCSLGTDADPQLPPLPQDSLIQAYFNHSQAHRYREPYRRQRRSGDDLEQVLVESIAAAQTSVIVAVQELRLPLVAQALADRQRAGVRVRVVLENNYSSPIQDSPQSQGDDAEDRDRRRYQELVQLVDQNGDGQLSPEELSQGDALVILDQAGVPRLDDTADGSKGSGLMHHKFVVIDGRTVITGSANFTPSGTHGDFSSAASRGNANHLLRITSPELAAVLTQEFDLLWGDGPGGKPDSRFGLKKPRRAPKTVNVGSTALTVHFSPTSPSVGWPNSSNGLIGATLAKAQTQVDLALFVFSEQPLANILQTRHQQGVRLRVLIDGGFAFQDYSEGLDLLGVTLGQANCQGEAGNQPWAQPITTVGVPQLPEGDLLHHKFGVIDGQTVITGSHNWSAAANHDNDETLLVLTNPTVAAHFNREFDRLYAIARLGLPKTVETKVQEYQQRCF